MKQAEKVVLQLYGQILQRLVKINMPSHERTAAVKQALQLALEAAGEFAKLIEEEDKDGEV